MCAYSFCSANYPLTRFCCLSMSHWKLLTATLSAVLVPGVGVNITPFPL